MEKVFDFVWSRFPVWLFAPERIFFLILALALVSACISAISVGNRLFPGRMVAIISDRRLKLGKILRTIDHLLFAALILMVVTALLAGKDIAFQIVLGGIAASCAFCVLCGLTTGLIPWNWRKKSMRTLRPVIDIRVEPVSFVLALFFNGLLFMILVIFALHGQPV